MAEVGKLRACAVYHMRLRCRFPILEKQACKVLLSANVESKSRLEKVSSWPLRTLMGDPPVII